jgi:excisionase family DNA binding protein
MQEDKAMMDTEPPLTVKEAAKTLNLSVACLRSWMAARKVAYLKLGRAIRIPASEIKRLVAASTVPALKVAGVGRRLAVPISENVIQPSTDYRTSTTSGITNEDVNG